MLFLMWLHVSAMVLAFAAFVGGSGFLHAVVARCEPATVRSFVRAVQPIFRAGGIAVAVGVIVGLILARGYSYGAPWLVGAYILLVIAAALGIGVEARWAERLAASDDAAYASVRPDRLPAIAGPLQAAVWLAILWLMIAKPS